MTHVICCFDSSVGFCEVLFQVAAILSEVRSHTAQNESAANQNKTAAQHQWDVSRTASPGSYVYDQRNECRTGDPEAR
jgi:hypothetical protein